MNILVNAYACRPNAGSEAGAAWKWITGLAKEHILYVITEGEWRSEIEEELLKTGYCSRIHFYYNPVSSKVRKMCWNQGDYRFYFYYETWQKKTLEIALTIIKERNIDLIHQLNMIGFREPGYLYKIKDIPLVWGPIGGMNLVPLRYMKDAKTIIKLKYFLKNSVTRLQYHYHPRVLKAIRRADALIAANKTAYEVLTRLYSEKRIFLISETGSEDSIKVFRKEINEKKFEILFVGRFIPTKLLGLALQVINRLKELPGLKFHIVGKAFDDTETKRYHEMAIQMGVDSLCEWHGWVSHNEVQDLMKQSDVFFFPSIVEGTPHVVLEAISNGLPVVCFDICGQAEAVNEDVGRKIPLTKPDESIIFFCNTLKELYYDRDLLKTLSANCSERKKALSWDTKIEKVQMIYNSITL